MGVFVGVLVGVLVGVNADGKRKKDLSRKPGHSA